MKTEEIYLVRDMNEYDYLMEELEGRGAIWQQGQKPTEYPGEDIPREMMTGLKNECLHILIRSGNKIVFDGETTSDDAKYKHPHVTYLEVFNIMPNNQIVWE